MLGFFPVTLSAPGTPGPFHVANHGLADSRFAR
jgi:hypothetical protein